MHVLNKDINTQVLYVLLMEERVGREGHKQGSDGFRGREGNTETADRRAESLKRIRCSPGRPWGKGS